MTIEEKIVEILNKTSLGHFNLLTLVDWINKNPEFKYKIKLDTDTHLWKVYKRRTRRGNNRKEV